MRDWDRPGHIKELVARVNQIRRENVALHNDWSLRFHETDNAEIIAYSKHTDDGANTILAVVNLDPVHVQHGWLRVPVGELAPRRAGSRTSCAILLTDEQFQWRGEWNYVRLEPGVRPAHIFRVTRE